MDRRNKIANDLSNNKQMQQISTEGAKDTTTLAGQDDPLGDVQEIEI